jgi:aryl-alcohol dehydrogenase-like predicted oxidoreductase
MLARLGVEVIDLYLAHEDDPDTPIADIAGAFDELVREGLIRAIGVSQFDAGRLAGWMDACAEHGYTAPSVLQPHYNLLDRDAYEGPLAETALRHGLAVTPFFSLARGFLSGKYQPGRDLPQGARAPGIARDYLNDRGFAVLAAVEEVAAARGATPAQVAIAWLLAKPGIVAPLASATRPEQVRDLMGALSVDLTPEDVARLDSSGG